MSRPRAFAALAGCALAALLTTAVTQAAAASLTRIEHDALVGGAHLFFVNDFLPPEGGQPWQAIGYVVDSDGTRNPSTWTSPDGTSWTRFPMQDTGSPERRDGPMSAARHGGMAVAIGNRFDGTTRNAAWWSASPSAWSAVPVSDPLVSYSGRVEAVSAGPDGFLAVGFRYVPSTTTVTVFRSADGRSWHVDSTFSVPGEDFRALDIASSGSRILVVGFSQLAPGSWDGRIWQKTDGAWSSIDVTSLGLVGPGLQQASTVVWSPTHGFVVAAITALQNTETPTILLSATGDAWQRWTVLEGAPAAVHQMRAVPGGFMAVGSSDAGPRIWRSANGRDWSLVRTPASGSTGGALLTFGSDGSRILYSVTRDNGSQFFRNEGAEWKRAETGPGFPKSKPHAAVLLDVAVNRGRVVAVGADGNGGPLVMSSASGGSWRREPFADKAARVTTVAPSGGGFTMAGWRELRGRAHLVLWTSRNGRTWQRLGGERRGPVGAFEEIVRGPSGLVALALEPGPRGFQTSAWSQVRGRWLSQVLGSGIPRAVCAGPHGAIAVATSGTEKSRVLVWTRPAKGRWSRQPELLATNSLATGCADGPRGTVVVGLDGDNAGVAWSRGRPGDRWVKSVVGATAPLTELLDVVRDGSGFLASGTSGDRGQADLAVWRSDDGSQWTRLGGADPASLEPGFQAGFGIAKVGGRVVVVGSHGAANAGLWVGTPSTLPP